jgi:hypothetical protein
MKTIQIKLNIHDKNFTKSLDNYDHVLLNKTVRGVFVNGLLFFNKNDVISSKGIIEIQSVFSENEGLYKNLETHIDEQGESFKVERILLSSFYEVI